MIICIIIFRNSCGYECFFVYIYLETFGVIYASLYTHSFKQSRIWIILCIHIFLNSYGYEWLFVYLYLETGGDMKDSL